MKPIIALLFAVLILAACDTNTAALPEETIGMLSVETQGELGIAQPSAFPTVLPSTNQYNFDNGWAFVSLFRPDLTSDPVRVGEIDLLLKSTRGFASCFEYRLDDEAPTDTRPNFNSGVTDGMWAFTCVNNTEHVLTLNPAAYVDVRMAFGAEKDERFDWTRFWVLTPLTKDACKNGSWQDLGFRNQGQCIASIEANANSVH